MQTSNLSINAMIIRVNGCAVTVILPVSIHISSEHVNIVSSVTDRQFQTLMQSKIVHYRDHRIPSKHSCDAI